MSQGTNQERIQQNNELLELNNAKLLEIKTKADNLPEKQNIKSINRPANYISHLAASDYTFNINGTDYTANRVVALDGYIIARINTTNLKGLFLFKNDNKELISQLTVPRDDSITNVYTAFGIHSIEQNKLIYFTTSANPSDTSRYWMYVYQIDLSTKDITVIKSFENSSALYCLSDTIQVSSFGDWIIFNVDTATTRVSRVSMIYNIRTGYSEGYSGSRWSYILNYRTLKSAYDTSYYQRKVTICNADGSIKDYDGNSQLESASMINPSLTKAIFSGSLYYINADGSKGQLIGGNYPTSRLCAINEKYYIAQGPSGTTVYEFNEETNDMIQILVINGACKLIGKTLSLGTTYYQFEDSNVPVAVLYDDNTYYAEARIVAGNSNEILSSKQFYNQNNEAVIGTMPNNGTINITPSTVNRTIPAGYTSGGSVAGDANLTPNNIRAGVSIFGVEGNVEPDKPDQEKTVIPTTEDQEVFGDTGYELGKVTVKGVTAEIDENIIAENIKQGTTILGVEGTLQEGTDTSDATATVDDVLSPETFYSNGELLSGAMPNNGVLNYTPTTEEQTIPAGYTSGGIVNAAVMSESDYDDCINLAKDILGSIIIPKLVDGMVSRYLASSYTSGTSWVDEISRKTGTVDATGTTKVDNYLHITSGHATTADINMYKGTFEICCKIPTTFAPNSSSDWYLCSCILGRELKERQRDFGIVINSSGYVSIGYDYFIIKASTLKINDSQLHTLTLTYDDSTYRLYADGVLLTSVNYTASGEIPTALGIFWNGDSGVTNVTGDIFDVRFYNKVLTAEELVANHAYDEFYYGGDN